MSEVLRDLVVSLSLDGDNFSRNLTSINKQIQEAESEFRRAASGVENFEKSVSGTQSQLSSLQQKLALQQKAVKQYEKALEAANKKLENAYARQGKLTESLDAAKQKNADLKQQVAAATKQYERFSRELGESDSATLAAKANLDALSQEYAESSAEVKKLEGQLATNTKSLQNNADAVTKARTNLNNAQGALRQTEQQIRTTTERLARMQSAWTKAGDTLTAFGKKCASVRASMEKLGKGMTTTLTTPVLALGTAAIKASMEYESAFTSVRKTVDATEDEYEQLSDSIKKMSTEVATDAADIAEVMANAGQLGIQNDYLVEFTRTMIDLGNSTDIAADEAATAIAQFANITKMSQADFGRFGSALVDLGNNYATTESAIMNMATRLAAAGSQVGLTQAQILGFATALSSVGLEAQAGGTAFSKAMIEMQVAVETNGKSLKDFARVAGMTTEEFKALWNSDPAGAIEKFIVGLSQMDEQGVSSIVTLQEMGFTEVRLRDTLMRATNATELFSEAQQTATSAWKDNVALSNEAGKRYATTESKLKNLKNTAVLAAQRIGDDLNPTVQRLIDGASDLIEKFMSLDESQRLMIIKFAAIAAAAGPAILVFSKIVKGVGTVSTGIGKFALTVAKAGGGWKGFLSVLSKSPAAWIAVAAAVIAATVALADYVSGAKQAREALQGMEDTARQWKDTAAETFYSQSEGLSFFGLDVFDVSDTGERQNSLRPNLWELQDQHMNAVHDALAERFGADDFMVAAQLERIANTMAQNYWEEHRQEIIDIVDGSYLADYDEFNIGVSFRNAAGVSIAYSLMSRCGLEPEDEFLHEDFLPVFDWNTPAAAAALGTAVSDISEQVLRTIEVTIRNEERRLENERTANEQPDLSAQRGLSDSQSDPGRDARNTPDEVRQDAKEIPAGAQADPVQSADTEREITAASAGDAGNRTEPDQSDGERDGEEQRRNGNPESSGRDGLGGPDEYASDAGGRNDSERPDLRIEEQAEQLSLFPPETEQIEQIDRMITTSAERPKPSALVLSEEDIDLVLRRGSGYENGKIRIAAMYAGNPSPKEALEFLKDEYGIGGYSHTYLDGTGGFVDYNGQGLRLSQRGFSEETRLRWPAVEQRIRRMIESGTYLTEKEQEHFAEMQRTYAGEALPAPHARMIYPPPLPDAPVKEHSTSESVSDEEPDWMDDIDPAAIREHLAESGIVNGEVVDPEALARNPFIQQVEADVAAIAAEEAAQTEAETPEQDISPPRPGERRIPAHDGIPAMREITIDLTGRNREPEPPVPDQSESAAWTPSEFSYDLHPGDTIYMDDRPFVVEDVRLSEVSFRDPSMVYPIFRVESKYILERILLPRDERNNQYRISPAHQQVSQQTGFSESPNVPLANESAEQSSSPESPSVLAETATNFRITDDHLGEGGQKTKYENNIRAIRTLKTLEKEHRPASPEDQEVLSKYVGWGGIPQAFDENNPSWSDKYRELKSLLTEEEYEMARASTLNAHYTSPTVIRAMYEALEQMGFRTGNVLEPSCGVGNFFGLLPESMTGSHLYGVELDSITGRIAQYLYPQAQIEVTGFEKTDRKDFFDVAVGNVPFGSYKLVDRQFDRYNFLIHDYFFAKALDQVRPGGIIAFITSKGTMDKQSPEVRKYIAQRAELLGAIRLPNSAFKANAGTEVTSDILFLQKRDHPIEIEPDWVHLGETVDGIPVNAYFAEHPEMVLGTMTWDDSMYGSKQETACLPIEGASLANQLHEAVSHIIGQYQAVEMPDLADGEAIRETIPADPSVRNYSYTVVDGNVYYRENSVMVRPELNATAQERVKGMVALRDCVYTLMDMQLTEASDKQIQAQQAELNRLYDDFTAKYGLLNSRGNAQAFSDDSSYYLLCSLEVLDEDGRLERKADMFSKRTIRQQRVVEHVDTASEALALSIAEKAKVDLSYMAELTGLSEESIADELTGVIFRLPAPVGEDGKPQFVTADEYLSGNVRQKLREARAAAEIAPIFEPNVRALEAAQPKDLDASEIDVRLGATWIDKDYIQQFMEELCEIPFYQKRAIRVQFSEYTAEWHINGKNIPSYSNVAVNMTYGTDRANALKILEDTLNLRDVRIYDTVTDPDGKERRVLNQKETTLAQQKQQAIKDAFRDWIWQDPYRRQALVEKYNEMFNSTRPREYDGQHITFSGMNPEITLREHQRNAVAHILYGGNTLLAHEVGAGKSATRS